MNEVKIRALKAFAAALIQQEKAQIIVPAQQPSPGFWFGGGNMAADREGNLYITGRYRNFGDSRSGTGMGERGLELALFRSVDGGARFDKVRSFSKKELAVGGREVLSIEGSALRITEEGVELYVSTEKTGRPFPAGLEHFQKPGTGSWTIEVMKAESVEALGSGGCETILENSDPRWFNMKDPFLHVQRNGDLLLGYCTHPYNWSSSNTGYVVRTKGASSFTPQNNSFFPRGFCWDVGITRGTAILPVPKTGLFREDDLNLLFYDGGEAMRYYEPHASAVSRPRGYSCEELGGLAFLTGDTMESVSRISIALPLFVSPHGKTGCSRYVDVLDTEEGWFSTWQQSQKDGSQPLVMHFLSRKEGEAILRG